MQRPPVQQYLKTIPDKELQKKNNYTMKNANKNGTVAHNNTKNGEQFLQTEQW